MRLDIHKVKSERPKTYLYTKCKACGKFLKKNQIKYLGYRGEVCKFLSNCENPNQNDILRKQYRR